MRLTGILKGLSRLFMCRQMILLSEVLGRGTMGVGGKVVKLGGFSM